MDPTLGVYYIFEVSDLMLTRPAPARLSDLGGQIHIFVLIALLIFLIIIEAAPDPTPTLVL